MRVSNDAKILVWKEEDLFYARRAEMPLEGPQACLGLDLFEIIADLAHLDLEIAAQAAEAIKLSGRAQRQLAVPSATPESPIDRLVDREYPPPRA
ncbi:MAG: hypothetical protein M3065_16500 [Actinomycetota bacterium]|nr:hypothetical protein [Actinomycetota bacterium]